MSPEESLTADDKVPSHFLDGVRVIELADELGEYCGRVLAGLGADVIKVEPLGGERTRSYGPFYHDEPHPNRSLYFWHYNYGKRGIVVDLDSAAGVEVFKQLVATAGVLIDTRPRTYLSERGLGYELLKSINPELIYTRISAFGDDGPYADCVGSDLVHLALGGVMMNCGYDSEPTGDYDTPPIAPQMWHAYHITGEVTAIQIMAALNYGLESGQGQQIAVSVHDAVSKNTETDLPDWVYARQPHYRQTCAHSFAFDPMSSSASRIPGISRTKDGRWLYPYRTYLPGVAAPFGHTVELLARYGCEEDLADPKYLDINYLRKPEVSLHVATIIDRFIVKFLYGRDLWKDGQAAGMPWAPVRLPEENVGDAHWAERNTFATVSYPELGESFVQVNAKWACPEVPWKAGPRAPLLNEHTADILAMLSAAPPSAGGEASSRNPAWCRHKVSPALSKHGKPFALAGVRVLDMAWLLASAGAGRFFAAHGAEVVKVEHVSRLDAYRMGPGTAPPGGREERDLATSPIATPAGVGVNRSGAFMEINAGKLGVSLNLKDPRGKDLLTRLIAQADILTEGFSPGTMERMGFGYERLREINPRIIYVQQSGMGQIGIYGNLRSYGPTAQAFSGLSEMSGLPAPYPPAGIGYSYLDWFGAYQMAVAMMSALYRRRRTGLGCWIDSSQVETGLYLTGTSILDFTVNGRHWSRYGNRSPYKPAAPHGAYRARGKDRWIAIASFTEAHWWGIAKVLNKPEWLSDSNLITLPLRLANQDRLDTMMNEATCSWGAHELMAALQREGVPAGACQTAEDRYEHDPQLRHLNWMVELEQSEIGRWPIKELTGLLSETPSYIGGVLDRSGPSYGEDNSLVLRSWLALDDAEIAKLHADGVL